MLAAPVKNAQNKHLHLFIFLVLTLLLFPFIEQSLRPEMPLVSMFFLAGLVFTLWALNLSKKIFVFFVVIAALIFTLETWLKTLPGGACCADTRLVTWVLYAVFMAACIAVMIKKVFSARLVAFDTIIGGINIYLLIAFLWAIFYELINLADPNAFNVHGEIGTVRLLYFSYSTISTLGLGDILPVNRFAMILSSFEAVTGQLYIAIFVAMLVGMHVSNRKP